MLKIKRFFGNLIVFSMLFTCATPAFAADFSSDNSAPHRIILSDQEASNILGAGGGGKGQDNRTFSVQFVNKTSVILSNSDKVGLIKVFIWSSQGSNVIVIGNSQNSQTYNAPSGWMVEKVGYLEGGSWKEIRNDKLSVTEITGITAKALAVSR